MALCLTDGPLAAVQVVLQTELHAASTSSVSQGMASPVAMTTFRMGSMLVMACETQEAGGKSLCNVLGTNRRVHASRCAEWMHAAVRLVRRDVAPHTHTYTHIYKEGPYYK